MFSENYSICLNDDGSPREIARNGPAVTYKAIGYDSGRVVAMELIPLASIDEVERVRFEENARMAQKLENANLAGVLDVGVEDDHFVFVSEYLEGETADSWIRAHGPMPADTVLRIGLQVMKVLAEAAIQGLTHPRYTRTRVKHTSSHLPRRQNFPALSNGKTNLSIFVLTFFLSGQRCGFS